MKKGLRTCAKRLAALSADISLNALIMAILYDMLSLTVWTDRSFFVFDNLSVRCSGSGLDIVKVL